MSPAKVFKLIGENENLYLKISHIIYNGTTYDVEREKDIMVWLKGQLNVSNVVFYEQYYDYKYLLKKELVGNMGYKAISDYYEIIDLYVDALKKLHTIDIINCPFDSTVRFRLKELKYLIDNKLADIDINNWQEDTKFTKPHDLYEYLVINKPHEELVFSHGDFGDSNIIINQNKEYGFIDLGRAGTADFWYDIAFIVRDIRNDFKDQKYLNYFFKKINVDPNWEKINYFILLDELF